jgi:integrase
MANQKVRLTNSVVAAAPVTDKEYTLWDAGIAGFGLRVRPTGGKSFIFTYRSPGGRAGKVQKVTIGSVESFNHKADAARDKAKELAGQHHGGIDPAAEIAAEKDEAAKEKAKPTMAAFLDTFIADHVKPTLKPKTAHEYERLCERILKPHLGKKKVAELTPVDVSTMYQEIRTRPTQAAAAVRCLSSAMSLAEEWGFRQPGSNPCRIRLKGARRRERLFSDLEVTRLLAMIDQHEVEKKMTTPIALALRLLFQTGCRAGELCDLEWENVDLDEGVICWPDSKTGTMEKAITPEAVTLFENAERFKDIPWVCPSPNMKKLRVETLEGAFERVMASAKVPANENATLHLIRHWFSTKTYSDPSLALPTQMKIVGHKSVATAMRYVHVARDELKKATAKAAKKRAAALATAEKKGKLIKFPAAG